ncbi:putative periplasmic protein [hydrocarbon metagenome]|uniref:Putative periplasmic protein n=1 Tax=hydrocarbon metagenome TaxID=938273 RepID=A0A0W8E348_9ZZZZ
MKIRNLLILLTIILALLFMVVIMPELSLSGLGNQLQNKIPDNSVQNIPSPVESIPAGQLTVPDLILLGAREEAKKGTLYDASYQVIDYPGGDVAHDRGACTDVVIRAFRNAGIDIQQLIHEDMLADFPSYPHNWGLNATDPNIDHRRVPNQVTFMSRHGKTLSLDPTQHPEDWNWGDVVYWKFPNGDEHCGIVSDRLNKRGLPLVIHNAGICQEEDALLRWEITGHYRYP